MVDWSAIGRFFEGGRGLPLMASRPAGALPYSPITKQAIAEHPLARLGWGQGLIRVDEVHLEPADALADWAPLAAAAAYMLREESDFAPVCDDDETFLGVVLIDDVLQSVADDRKVPTVAQVLTTQIPTCAPHSALVDAVRTMIACYFRKIPVIGDAGRLLGLLTLSEAAAASARDPAVTEVLERFGDSPSLYARRMR
jgi:predicted transcriptional regulator